MRTSSIFNMFLVIVLFLLPGCTTQLHVTETRAAGSPPPGAELTQADPHLDQIVAWVPRERASTAAQAEALVHVELGRAKEALGKTLCGGTWPINGARVTSAGPYPATAPAALGGYPAWYYHLGNKPGFAGCAPVPMATLYQELDDRLPPWIRVTAAASRINGASGKEMTAETTSR